MSDLINRQDAIDGIREYINEYKYNDIKWAAMKEAEMLIESLPSADLKKMVGCTGCEHYDQQQTAMICRECRRYYKDMYEG